MQMPKPTDEDKARFRALVPDDPRVEITPMFGQLAAFVNANMFMGLFGADIGLRLPDDQRERLMLEDGAGPFGPAERPMSGYVTLPAKWLDKPNLADPWIGRAFDHTAAMPPKKPKVKKKG